MKKAITAIGMGKAMRFVVGQFWATLLAMRLLLPPFRTGLLRLLGSKVGKDTVIHHSSFFNVYRKGFRALHVGDRCFIGDECLIDLAESITMESDVTVAERVVVLTHTNVGYDSHPLQEHVKTMQKPVVLKEGSFVGSSSTILPGVTVGKMAVVAAGSVVTEDVPSRTVVAGVPAKTVKVLE